MTISRGQTETDGELCDAALSAYRSGWDSTGTPWPGMDPAHYLAHQSAVLAVAKRHGIPYEIRKRLTSLQVGGCTCLTKTPELKYHKETCHYRLASEIESLLLTGKTGT